MYHYIEDKEFLKNMKSLCSDIMNQLVQQINNDGRMTVKIHLIGSGVKNLITQNEKEPIDLDYNLAILDLGDFRARPKRDLKEYVRTQFNIVLNRNGWGDCMDSTSALTTKQYSFPKGNRTKFSIDLGIVRFDNYGWHRLIHHKTGIVAFDDYVWNQVPDSHGLEKKVDAIKSADLWNEVRHTYKEKKNMYLTRQDYNHPSFNVYIETINEIYSKYFSNNMGYGSIFSHH